MDKAIIDFGTTIFQPSINNLSFTPENFLSSLYSVTYYLTMAACMIAFVLATLTFLTSTGDPGKVKKAREYLTAGITSLVVIVGAGYFFELLQGIQNYQSSMGTGGPETTSGGLFEFLLKSMGDVLTFGLELGFVLVALFIAWGGITYLFSAGDPGRIKKAVSTITYALLGLVILLLFFAISQFILGITGYTSSATRSQTFNINH